MNVKARVEHRRELPDPLQSLTRRIAVDTKHLAVTIERVSAIPVNLPQIPAGKLDRASSLLLRHGIAWNAIDAGLRSHDVEFQGNGIVRSGPAVTRGHSAAPFAKCRVQSRRS